MTYAGPSTFAGASPFGGASIAAVSPFQIAAPFAGPRPFAGPAPFAGMVVPGGGDTPPPPPTAVIYATDFASASDGLKATAGGSFGLFDAFMDLDGTILESHAPTGGSGAWGKHPAYASGSLSIVTYGEGRLARNNWLAVPSTYITDRSATDSRATWTQGDHDVVYTADARCGVGLRVDPIADAGYYALAYNDELAGTSTWRIVKRVAGVETTLASASKPSLVLTPASLEFTAVGGVLTLKVNGSTVATAIDSAIPGPGRFAVAFQPLVEPEGTAGSWIDDLSIGDVGLSSRLAPERVVAGVSGAEAVGAPERHMLIASTFAVASVDAGWAAERGRVSAAVRGADGAGASEGRWVAARLAGVDAVAGVDGFAASASITSSDDTSFASAVSISAVVIVIAVAATDSGDAAEAAAVTANLWARDETTLSSASALAVGVWSVDAASAASAWSTRVLIATLTYSIYGNDGDGGPIDYATPLGTTTTTSWATPPLAVPGLHRFGVRVTSMLSGLEESNADATVAIDLDESGIDVTRRPPPVTDLRAYAAAGGVLRVEWSHSLPTGANKPAGFRVYVGSPAPDFSAPFITIPATAALAGTFRIDLAGLADGVPVAIAVRAYNATSEDGAPPTAYITATPDATPPDAVDGLTGTTV